MRHGSRGMERRPDHRPSPGSRAAVAALLVALGSQLQACTRADGVEGRGVPAAPTARRVTAEWYEVVSQQPGPEVRDATMRRKIEESGQPWKVRDRATGIEMVL